MDLRVLVWPFEKNCLTNGSEENGRKVCKKENFISKLISMENLFPTRSYINWGSSWFLWKLSRGLRIKLLIQMDVEQMVT